MRFPSLPVLAIVCINAALAADAASADVDILKPATSVRIERNGQTQSFPNAKAALAAAAAGDVIVLSPGTHEGPLVVQTSGITLSGMPGARVSGNSATWKPTWKKESKYGPFAYSSPIPFEPAVVTMDNRVLINIDEDRDGPGIHEKGAGRSGRVPLQGLFSWVSKSRSVVVSFAQDTDPAKHSIEAAPSDAAAIVIRNADNCTVKSLIVTGGSSGVMLYNTRNSTLQQCLIYAVDVGVRLGKGAASCKVLSCDITWNPDALGKDCDPVTVPRDIWMAHKNSGTYDKHGILIQPAGSDNEIAYNYLYNVWDGIEANDGVGKADIEAHYRNKVLKGIAQSNRGLQVHHNRIDLAMDDAMRPGCELADNQWYSNIVTRAGCATRISTVTMGPFFFYDNLLLDCGDGMRLYKSMPESANIYIFHNLIKHSAAVIYHNMDSVAWDNAWLKQTLPKGTPGVRIYNNLFLCRSAFGRNEGEVAPNFTGDYNVYSSSPNVETAARGIDAHSLFKADPQFVDPDHGDYRLKPGSPARGGGCDLATLDLKAQLPANLAAATGKRPDAGLLGLDAARTPHGPVSGLWDLAQRQLGLGERDPTQFTLPPVRWITAKQCQFIIKDLPARDELALTCDRSGNGAKVRYKLTVSDENDKVLLSRDAKSLADKEGMVLSIPLKGARQLRLSIEDQAEARWAVQADATVCIDAGKGLSLSKGDAARFIFDYPVTADIKSFTVTMHSKYNGGKLEIAPPGGKPESVDKTVTIPTDGVAGTYRILVSFTKSAELKIEAPRTELVLSKAQEVVPLRKLWGKPAF